MIEISRVVKIFGKRCGLDGFSLTVPAGSLFGLVGPNGAGKSTLMKVLAGLIERDSGTVTIDRADPALQPLVVRAMIGYQPDFAGVYQGMRVHEYLEFFADAFKLGSRKKNAIALALKRSRLEERPNDFVEELSFGWKQRLVLAKTLLHEPKVLLLDEPAIGLDPIARIDLRQQLKSLNADGLTILISSHILADIEDICTHVAFIENGANAAGADGRSTVELHPQAEDEQEYEIAWLGEADIEVFVAQNPHVKLISTEGSKARVSIAAGASSAAVALQSLVAFGIQITRFAESNDGLENRYQKVFGGRR